MSRSDLLTFQETASADPQLRAEAMRALEAGSGAVVALGAREGFHFTGEEVNKAVSVDAAEGELSDDDLDLVAGGSTCPATATIDKGQTCA